MYQKIMVPLDGSQLAECVIPHAEAIAKGGGVGTVIFVRVVEPVVQRLPAIGADTYTFTKEQLEGMKSAAQSAAQDYINNVVSRVKSGGVGAVGEVIPLSYDIKPADVLADYAEKNGVDLIVMATHGRSGASRWAWGGVADRMLRAACVPVLMVRAPGCVPGK